MYRVQVPVADMSKKGDGDVSSLFAGSLDIQEGKPTPEGSTQLREYATVNTELRPQENDDEVEITGIGKSESNKYYQGINISTHMLEQITRQGEWLSDESVNFTQTLLREQFPTCKRFRVHHTWPSSEFFSPWRRICASSSQWLRPLGLRVEHWMPEG